MTTETPVLDLTPLPAGGPVASAPQSPSFTTADPADQAEREAAFSSEFFWDNKKLHGFSIDRYSAFLSQRVSMAAPPLSRTMRDGAGFYPDAVRILWCCSVDADTISLFRSQPLIMQFAIDQWAAINAPSWRTDEALDVAINIWNASQVNQHDPRHSSAPGTGPSSLGN